MSSSASVSACTLPCSGGENLSLEWEETEVILGADSRWTSSCYLCFIILRFSLLQRELGETLDSSSGEWKLHNLLSEKNPSKCQVEDMKLLLNESLVMQLTRKQKISLIKLAVAEFMKMLRWQTRWVGHDQLMIARRLQVQLWPSSVCSVATWTPAAFPCLSEGFLIHSQSRSGSSVKPVSKTAALKSTYCSHGSSQVQGHLVILWLTCDFQRLPYGFTDLNLSQAIEWGTEELESLFHLSDNQHQSDFGFSISEDESQGMKQFCQYQSIYTLYHSFI